MDFVYKFTNVDSTGYSLSDSCSSDDSSSNGYSPRDVDNRFTPFSSATVSGKRSCASKQALSISGAIQKGVHFLANKAVDIPASSRGPLSKPLAVDAPVQTPLVRNLHGEIVKEKGRTFNSARASSAEVPVLVPVAEMDEKPAEGLAAMGSATSLSKNERPRLPDKFYKLLTKPRLKAIKQYIESFQYRLNVQTNFNAHKLRPLSRIMDTARMIVYAPQPIKCVEAVFVALYLTAGLLDVERVPLGFKTELNGQEYQHIVLLVQHEGKYGAFGISRCPDLMNKDLIFNSMSSVIENFKLAYEEQQHSVLKVRIGLPVEHNLVSPNFVCWRHLNLNLQYESWPQCVEAIEKHAVKGKRLWDLWILAGKGEDPQKNSSPRKAPLDNRYYGYDSAKKKLITSHELSPLKVKSIMYGDHSFAGESSTSGIPIDDPTGTQTSSLRKQYDANINAELSVPKKCLETKVIAPFPTAVGNSRFRRTEKASEKGLTQVDTLQARKMMRDVVQPLPRLARGFDQTLAVNRSFLRTKSFKGTSNTVVRSPTHGPKVSARRKMVIMGRSTLIARIPARLHCQTFDGDTLFPRHPHR